MAKKTEELDELLKLWKMIGCCARSLITQFLKRLFQQGKVFLKGKESFLKNILTIEQPIKRKWK